MVGAVVIGAVFVVGRSCPFPPISIGLIIGNKQLRPTTKTTPMTTAPTNSAPYHSSLSIDQPKPIRPVIECYIYFIDIGYVALTDRLGYATLRVKLD